MPIGSYGGEVQLFQLDLPNISANRNKIVKMMCHCQAPFSSDKIYTYIQMSTLMYVKKKSSTKNDVFGTTLPFQFSSTLFPSPSHFIYYNEVWFIQF